MRFALLFLALGACADEGYAPDPVAPTTTPSPAPTTTSPSTVDTGWVCNEWYPCQDCGGVACGAEINACAGDPGCGAALNAWAGCVLDCGDPEVCADDFAASGSLADALLACTVASCAEECGL